MQTVADPTHQERRIPMSYAEYLEFVDENTQAEWVAGETIIFMPPTTTHQQVVQFLLVLVSTFASFFKLGQVLAGPVEMKVSPEGSAREPDLLFVSAEHAARITEKNLRGPADLIVEVISDESVRRDRDDKFYEYQEAGVREYWIVDPRLRRQRTDFYVLDESGRYTSVPAGKDGVYHSTVIPGFWLDVNWLLADELPDPLRTLARVIGPEKVIQALGALE